MNTDKTNDAVQLRGIDYQWPGQDDFRLRLDAFDVARGERVLLLGSSGSGKSTLLSLMTGIIAPDEGSVKVLGTDVNALGSSGRDRFRAEHFGIVFQMFNLLPYGGVLDNVVLPLSFAPDRKARAERVGGVLAEAHRLLKALEIDESLQQKKASELSIGQQQRVAVARALIGSPEIIVADEPTSALDTDRQTRFLDLLFSQVETTGSTLIMVSHDLSLCDRFDRSIHLQDILQRTKRVEEVS